MLGSAPAPLFENFSRGVRFLNLFRMLGFGLIPRNFRILGARIRKNLIMRNMTVVWIKFTMP